MPHKSPLLTFHRQQFSTLHIRLASTVINLTNSMARKNHSSMWFGINKFTVCLTLLINSLEIPFVSNKVANWPFECGRERKISKKLIKTFFICVNTNILLLLTLNTKKETSNRWKAGDNFIVLKIQRNWVYWGNKRSFNWQLKCLLRLAVI